MSAEATSSTNPLTWKLLRRLRTAMPLRASFYVSQPTANVFQVMAARACSQPEFIFFQMAASVATLSRRIIINNGPNSPPTHPNMFMNVGASPKSGKTTGQVVVEKIRKWVYNATGLNNEVLAGTNAGVYKNAVVCAKRGGLPLHCPDEGISSLNSLLMPPPAGTNSFRAEVFLSSGWSGADVARAKATAENMQTEYARLTILAMGTLTDVAAFHRLCQQHYSSRGLEGRFFTAFAPSYTARCALPDPTNEEEDSLLALNATELSGLIGQALLSVYQKAEVPDFQGFRLADDALVAINDLRTRETSRNEEAEEEQHWSDSLRNRLLSYIEEEFRFTEMVEKWTLVLHVLEIVFNGINFIERTITAEALPQLISLETVERARALVERAHEQDMYFLQVLRIATTMRNRDVVYVIENVDFVLYKCLRQILIVWPGPVVTSESFTDRCSKLGINIPFENVAAAAQELAEMGTLTRNSTSARITCPGIYHQSRIPRQAFRFFKAHPDLINLELLEELHISLQDYTVRYNLDFYQIVEAQCLRAQRKTEFNEWVGEMPGALLPRQEGGATTADALNESPGSSGTLPTYPKYAKYQHESVDLRFGAALLKKPPKAVKRSHSTARSEESSSPSQLQHLFRLPGAPSFSNAKP